MRNTYKAVLRGDRLEWSGDAPDDIHPDQTVAVRVTVLDEDPATLAADGELMTAALEQLAASRSLSDLTDPVAWERETRRERPLPGRDR